MPAQVELPATAMQESMWWIHHRSTIKSVYNLTWRMSCAAAVDPVALRTAWQAVHDRHDALRSGLRQQDGAVFMVVQPAVTAELERVAVTEPGPAPADALLALLAEELHERPFDLSRPLLTRLALVTVADRHELVLTVHHSMIDGWGMQLLVGDLSAAYRSALAGEPLPPAPEPPSFADYARRDQAARADGRWQAGTQDWRGYLNGAASSTVAADHHRYTGTGGRGEMLHVVFGPAAQDGITAQAKQAAATPFAVLLAAFQAVLARGGAGPDVAVGIAAANRMTRRDQALVGYTSNLCISRAVVRDEEKFADVVTRARDDLWTMLARQDVPYPLVVGALDDQTRARLRDVPPMLLSYYGPIGSGLHLGDITLRLMPSPNRAARSDISFGLFELDGQQAVEAEYDAGRYDRRTALRLLGDIEATLAAAAARPDLRVADLAVRTRSTFAYLDHGDEVLVRPEGDAPGADALRHAYRLWAEVLGDPPADPDEDFFACGGRSLKAVELMAVIEAESGREFDVESWLGRPTPRQLASLLSAPPAASENAASEAAASQTPAEAATGEQSTLVDLRAGPGPHLHLLPGAGAAADWYADLLAALPGSWRVTLSQERGPMTSVAEMADRYLADLTAAGLRPDLLVGWSLGGQTAHLMAARYGDPVPRVALLDSPPPVGYSFGDDEVFGAFAERLLHALGAPPAATPPRTGPGEELGLRALAAYLAAIGQPIPFGMVAQRWQVYGRHARAAAAHRSDQRVTGPALLVAADLDEAELDQWASRFEPAPRRMRVAADHLGMLRNPAASDIATAIQALAAPAAASRDQPDGTSRR